MSAFLAPTPDPAPRESTVRLRAMDADDLDAVIAIEQRSYAQAWTRGNFRDSLQAGYAMRCLARERQVIGYFVAMAGVREVHLLNLAVAPDYRRQGWAHVLLDALALWAWAQDAEAIWLEVRAGNARALQVYERHGFQRVGLRRDYYPAIHRRREDAVLMTLPLATGTRSRAEVAP